MKLHLQHNARQAKLNGVWERFTAELSARESATELEVWWQSDGTIALVQSMPPIWQEHAVEQYEARWEWLRCD